MDESHKDQIFICYRRDDSAWVTGRLYDRLVQRFGEGSVFKDIDSIPLGTNFKQHINSVLEQCSVVVVVIGDKWIDKRLNDPRDHVRIEIESALQRDIPVIPLLVQNATMPHEQSLPESLRELHYRNGIPINNDPHFHVDMNRLIKSLETILLQKRLTVPEPIRKRLTWLPSIPQKRIILFVGSIFFITVTVIILINWKRVTGGSPTLNEPRFAESPTPAPTNTTLSPAPTSTTPSDDIGENQSIATVLPESGIGYVTNNRGPSGKFQFGLASTINAIQDLGRAWASRGVQVRLVGSGPVRYRDVPISIGQISLKGGGPMPPRRNHRDGREFDIRPIRTDGQNASVTISDAVYSRDLTKELVSLLKSLFPQAQIKFNDSDLVTQGLTTFGQGFHDHIHVRLP